MRKTSGWHGWGFGAALLVAVLAWPVAAKAAELDAAKIGEAAGAKATATPDGVVRIGWPRTDVKVTVDGMPLDPFAGLGSWAAFTAMGDAGAMVMGDTVVFEDEVDAALDAAFAGGLEVSALHNHFFHDQPPVFFMHLGGHGEPEDLARAVKGVWDAIRAVRAATPSPAAVFSGETPKADKIDSAPLEKILGKKPDIQNNVVKFTFGREGKMHGQTISGSMGLTTWAAFSGSDALTAADGDVIMTSDEVQPVVRALRKAGFHVVALHNHMIGEEPGFIFTHFWGKGPAEKLAQGLASVLEAQREAKGAAERTR